MNNTELVVDENGFPDPDGDLLNLSTLPKYIHNPAFTQRFINAAATGQEAVERIQYYPDEKKISFQELKDGGYEFFFQRQEEYAKEFEARLNSVIEPKKVDKFITAFKEKWIDGAASRHKSAEMLSIKASLRDYDSAWHTNKTVFVNSKNVPTDNVAALFDPWEMHQILDVTSLMANTAIEDYLENRSNGNFDSINLIYLHRGIFRPQTDDKIQVEEHYLSSYSMSVTVPEVFAQTKTAQTEQVGRVAMLAAPFPLFNNRIVMFSPFINGMKLGQLEVCVAPPLEVLPLQFCGTFESGHPGLEFDEYEFNELPPFKKWVGPIPKRVKKTT